MKILLFVLIFIFSLVNFVGCGQYLDRATNVLYSKPDFLTAKSFIPNGAASAQEFVFERPALAHDRLNLATWHGYNEVIWNQNEAWQEVGLKATLQESSYLWIFIINDTEQRLGFRISRNPLFKSGFFILNQDKEFKEVEAFELHDLNSTQEIKLNYQNQNLTLSLNNQKIYERNIRLEHQLLSLRSSLAGSLSVDDLYMIKANGEKISEDFSPRLQMSNWLISFVIQLINLALLLLLYKRGQINRTQLTAVMGVMSVILCFWVWLDKEKIAEKYYTISRLNWYGVYLQYPDTILEVARRKSLYVVNSLLGQKQNAFILSFKDYNRDFIIPENTKEIPEFAKAIYRTNGLEINTLVTRRKYINAKGELKFLENFSDLKNADSTGQRFVYMGSSPAYGGGVSDLSKIFVSQLTQKIRECSKQAVTSLNISSPGDKIEYFVETYKEVLQYWKPTLLIINLGSNDRNVELYRNKLIELIELNNKSGIKTALVKESNSIESSSGRLLDKYKILEEVSQKYQVPLLDMDAHINAKEIYDTGLLWVDLAHYDRAGHNIVAQWLFEQLKKQNLVTCQ